MRVLVILALSACASDSAVDQLRVTLTCSQASATASAELSCGATVMVEPGTTVTVTCTANVQGVCFAVPCSVAPSSEDTTASGDNRCSALVVEDTQFRCACAEAIR